LVQSYSYDAYGNSLGDTKDNNNFRYVGGSDVFSDDDVSLQYMHHRWFDPSLGRFVTRDPLGFKGGNYNLYCYAGNNPLLAFDSSGLLSLIIQFSKSISFDLTKNPTDNNNEWFGNGWGIGIDLTTGQFLFEKSTYDLQGYGQGEFYGLGGNVSWDDDPLAGHSETSSNTENLNGGFIFAAGASGDTDANGNLTGAGGIPIPKLDEFGAGIGYEDSQGSQTTDTWATPPLWNFSIDSVNGSLSSFFASLADLISF
jgi:RHS repeat-associated protein